MTIETRAPWLRLAVGFTTLLLVLTPAQSFGQTVPATRSRSPKPIVLLVTNPSVSVLSSFVALVEHKYIEVGKLRIIGIYHAKTEGEFTASKRFIREKKLGWLSLKQVACEISATTVFQSNGCSSQFRELVSLSTGIAFTGGPDIPPTLYGEETLLTTRVTAPNRMYFEISFLFHLVGRRDRPRFTALLSKRPDYIVLGLCLGMQALNVAAGGTLYQDIPSELYGAKTAEDVLAMDKRLRHRSYRHFINPSLNRVHWVTHPIVLEPAWRFTPIPRGRRYLPYVVSSHHQAVEKLGDDLLVLAASVDGKVVEALGHRRFPNVVGLQFHPERVVAASGACDACAAAGATDTTVPRIDDSSVRFHRAFWRTISRRLESR